MSDEAQFVLDIQTRGAAGIEAAAASVDTLAVNAGTMAKVVQAAEVHYERMEFAAVRASKATEKYALAIDVQNAKLTAAKNRGDDKGAAAAAAKIEELSILQTKATKESERLSTALQHEAKALDQLKDKAAKASHESEKGGVRFQTLGRALGKFGPIGDAAGRSIVEVVDGAEKLGKAFEGASALGGFTVGIVALTAAFVALGVAVVAVTAKIATWAVGLANANRQSSLLAQGMVQSVKGGEALNAEIRSITARLPVSSEEVAGWAKQWAYAGYRGKDLNGILEQTAKWTARLKFGPNFAAEMLSLDEQSKVLKQNLSNLFGHLKIEGLLQALQLIIALTDETTESGQAIKVVFESIFQPLVNGVADSKYKVERFFLEFEILALKALIAIKPWGSTIMKIGEVFLIVAGIITGLVVVAIGLLVTSFLAALAPLFAVVAAFVFFKKQIVAAFNEVKHFLSNFTLADVAAAMIGGLAGGITSAGPRVLAALKGVVMDAVHGVKDLLGIHSPSTVFRDQVGYQIGAGTAEGVERATPMVRSAYAGLAAPPDAPTPQGASGSSGGASAGRSIENLTINVTEAKDGADTAQKIREVVLRIIEGDAAQVGAVAPG